MFDEPGLELIPGTHKRWDEDDELDVRFAQNGRKHHEDLARGVSIKLDAGDLLIFSAVMIHRGLYGMGRMSFDILFADPVPALMASVDESCLPDSAIMAKLENADAFKRTIEIKTNK